MANTLNSPARRAEPRPQLEVRGFVAARWASLVLALLSAGMLLWTFQVGRDLSMPDTLSKLSWARAQYSTGIAVSRIEYGAPGYLILSQVWSDLSKRGFASDISYQPSNPNIGISDALGQKINYDLPRNVLYLDDWGDDKGNADYFMLAFLLFGLNIQALYHLYFLILGISVAIFVVQFFKSPGYLVLAPIYLAAHHLAVITLLDSLVTSVVHDAHFLAAAACLASLHVALLLTRSERISLWAVAGLLVQIAIMIFVIDSRPSAIWLVYFPIGTFGLWLALSFVRRQRPSGLLRLVVERGLIVVLLFAGPKLLGAYHSMAFDRTYTENGIESHMVWHSLYMGLSVHPDGPTYGLIYTDATSYAAAYKHLVAHPELARSLQIDTSSFTFDQHAPQAWITSAIGFRRYEQIGKENFLSFVAEHPRFIAESFLYYKPKYLIEQILWQAGLLREWPAWVKIEVAHSPPTRHPLDLLSFPAIAVVLLSVSAVMAGGGADRRATWMSLSLLLFLASLLPSIAVAPIYYELSVVFALVAMLLYVSGAALFITVVRALARFVTDRPAQTRRSQLAATGAAITLVLAVAILVGSEGNAPTVPGSAVTPGRLPRELVRDNFGQIWVLTFDRLRRPLPDWDTYLAYGGNPNPQSLRQIDDEETKETQPRVLAPRANQAGLAPGQVVVPAEPTRSLDPNVSFGSVVLPAGSVNVALGRPTTMSGGGDSASLAVDGNMSGHMLDGSIATVRYPQPQAWWQVDLGSVQPISSVQVWPRTDGCCSQPPSSSAVNVAERLHNFVVLVSDQQLIGDDAAAIRRQPGIMSQFALGWAGSPTTIAVNRTARYVRIQRAYPSTLEIAEVQVWTDPR